MSKAKKISAPLVTIAAAFDAVLVLLFAGIGRGSHSEAVTFAGIFETAWPFLAGLAIMWVITFAFRRPLAIVSTALPLWVGTVVIGMLLRAVTGQGTATAFIIVATVTLGLFLVGWRVIVKLIRRGKKA